MLAERLYPCGLVTDLAGGVEVAVLFRLRRDRVTQVGGVLTLGREPVAYPGEILTQLRNGVVDRLRCLNA